MKSIRGINEQSEQKFLLILFMLIMSRLLSGGYGKILLENHHIKRLHKIVKLPLLMSKELLMLNACKGSSAQLMERFIVTSRGLQLKAANISIEYNREEVFALIARLNVVRMLISFATPHNWKVYQMDVKSDSEMAYYERESKWSNQNAS